MNMKNSSFRQNRPTKITRRSALTGLGLAAGWTALGKSTDQTDSRYSPHAIPLLSRQEIRAQIFKKVLSTQLVDSHEHLPDESERLSANPPLNRVNDWSILFSHYLDSDLIAAGMSRQDMDRFLSDQLEPMDKWPLIEPYWPSVRNTGYGQATAIAIAELYDIQHLTAGAIPELQKRFEQTLKPGLYEHVLREKANIHSCQVNSLTDNIFTETESPQLLMQDMRIDGFFSWLPIHEFSDRSGIAVHDINDWYRVINYYFSKYGTMAVGVKSSQAYGRNIDYEEVSVEVAAPLFEKVLVQDQLEPGEKKQLEDHLFWYCVEKCNEYHLPVKLHTGYYAGDNNMPLSRVAGNAAAAADLCRRSPGTRFVFFHICYPYYEDLLAVAKQYSNAIVDMCWAWIINPVAAKDFLKKFLVTVPSNKLLTFGGDYIPVEPVLGHAVLARHGIAESLSELVEEGWISLDDALQLTDPIMHLNAKTIFDIHG